MVVSTRIHWVFEEAGRVGGGMAGGGANNLTAAAGFMPLNLHLQPHEQRVGKA